MKHRNVPWAGALWIALYLVIALAPVFLMLAGPRPQGRPYLRDLSVALAFSGMSVIGLQFVLTARIPSLKRPFGSDVVYFFHHQMSVVGLGLVLAHIVLLIVIDRSTIQLFNVATAPLRARFAVAGLFSLLLLVVVSLIRKKIRLEYTAWRISHGLIAIGAATFAMTHMQLVGHYLSSPWKRALWAGYALLWVGTILYARVFRPLLLRLRPFEIAEILEERGNAWTVSLRPVGHTGSRFHPGQFAWLTIGRSPFSDLEHPFSYVSSAEQPDNPRFTIKALGNFTSTIPQLEPGTRVYVDGPFGAFTPDRRPHAEAFIFVAGGVGITPIMSMLRTMQDRQDRRPCLLLYGVRSEQDATFLEELRELERAANLTLVLVPTVAAPTWVGPSGRITRDVLETSIPEALRTSATEAFLCGPPVMMESIEISLQDLGFALRKIHAERFNLA